ncbi:MAG: hypothetical protein EXS00_01375 [Phycisphaerales bacterium]|nr:hypothetical protein [Phycisphaerales bacterium]
MNDMVPRDLVSWGALWLGASIAFGIGVSAPIEPSLNSYHPAVLRTVVLCATGLIVAWPLLRLSEAPCPTPVRSSLLDLLTVACLLQLVLWPLRLISSWTVAEVASLDAMLLAHAACICGLLAWARGSRLGWERALAMFLCLLSGAAHAAAAAPGTAETWALAAVLLVAGVAASTLRNLAPVPSEG